MVINRKILILLLLLFNITNGQIPTKVVITYLGLNDESPFNMTCDNIEVSKYSSCSQIIIDNKRDLIKFQKILNKIRYTSTDYEPDVRIKIEAYYKKHKTTICLGAGNSLINGHPVEYSEGLVLYIESMKSKYKSRTGAEK
jgi:hypothetical protein